ncbi:unnamed protein product [Heligmosomoides polygyrus]|uniref:Uncharacterized protein n=1 Tax=Heligmosomoides polygyrus TaxID=6339 RepID=A0A3P7W0S9_HELPZ|nr:unnamed protein product [Heligmosomoides polygyrus]
MGRRLRSEGTARHLHHGRSVPNLDRKRHQQISD